MHGTCIKISNLSCFCLSEGHWTNIYSYLAQSKSKFVPNTSSLLIIIHEHHLDFPPPKGNYFTNCVFLHDSLWDFHEFGNYGLMIFDTV